MEQYKKLVKLKQMCLKNPSVSKDFEDSIDELLVDAAFNENKITCLLNEFPTVYRKVVVERK